MNFSKILHNLWDKLYGWVESMVLLLPNMVVAAMIVALFAVLARYSAGMVGKLAQRLSHNRALSRLSVNIYKIMLIAIGVFIALGVLKLEKTVTSLLAGAGIIGLALGFAFQDISANFISGVYMALKRPIKPGDLIKTNGYFGTVQEIDLRTLRLQTPQGQEIIIPNRQIMEKPLEQFSTSSRRIDLAVGVSYGDDLQKVEDLALEAISELPNLAENKEVKLYYREFGDSSINFELHYWIPNNGRADYLGALSEGIKAIKSAFDQNDITIPFPIRTLDFGIKGGESLRQALPTQIKNEKVQYTHSDN